MRTVSAGSGQPGLTSTSRAQCRRSASGSKPAIHWPACESPIRTIRSLLSSSPKRQRGLFSAESGISQSRPGGKSVLARASEGVRASTRVPGASRSGPSAAPAGAPAASALPSARTVPPPSVSPAISGMVSAAEAIARPRRGAAEPSRSGFSTRRPVSQAGRAAAAVRATAAVHGSGPYLAWAIVRTGQCHRYQLYERRPTARSGRVASRRPASGAPSGCPCEAASRTAAVPSTGSSAALPG